MSDEHLKSVSCEKCGNWASACICDEPSSLAAMPGYPAPEEMLKIICEASRHPLDVVMVGLKETAKEYGLGEPVMLERLYCDALRVLDNGRS